MRIEIAEALWLDAKHELSLVQLAELSGLTMAELQHLVDCEALSPLARGLEPADARFSAECLSLTRIVTRLRDDFDLDATALALTLQLLRRIHELETEVLSYRAQAPRTPR